MSEFVVYPGRLRKISKQYRDMSDDMKDYKAQIHDVGANLQGSSYSAIKDVLVELENDSQTFLQELADMGTKLGQMMDLYEKTEDELSQQKKEFSHLKKKSEEADDKPNDLKKIFDLLMDCVTSGGSLSAQAKPYLDILFSMMFGEDVGPEIAAEFLESTANKYSFLASWAEDGWDAAVIEGLGLVEYFKDVNPNATFKELFKLSWKQELKSHIDFTDFKSGAGSVAKWAGSLISLISNGVDNYEEFGNQVTARGVAETVLETGVDIAMGAGATVLGAAAFGASTPAIAVGAIGVGLTFGADWISEKFTGEKLSENVANYLCDGAEVIGKCF